MGKYAMTNVGLFVDDFDVGVDVNQCNLLVSIEELDVTTFKAADATDHGWEESIAGTRSAGFDFSGFADYSAADLEGEALANLGVSSPVTVLPDMTSTPVLGDRAFFLQTRRLNVDWLGAHGEVSPVAITSKLTSGPLVRGELMIPKAAITSTSASAMSQIGAVTASQKVYAALHVFTVTGTNPTLDVIVESDDNSTPTSPTTRLTFTQATAKTSEWQELVGAITDDYWRVSYTIGGTDTPTFTFAVSVGVA